MEQGCKPCMGRGEHMNDRYESPFSTRYGSEKMREIFSPKMRHIIWRRLWIALAKGEQFLGLDISEEQIREMSFHMHTIPYDKIEEIENEVQHDVMAHLKVYASQCPKASPIIHLGATSAYIVDNAEVIIMKRAIRHIRDRLNDLIGVMEMNAREHAFTPTLAYTHLQPAQPTTFGKRMCTWIQDLRCDKSRLFTEELVSLKMLGCKGATGTCASFMELFDRDYSKVKELDTFISQYFNINVVKVSGQTYSRKQDYYVFSILSGIAQTLSKIANDLRLMSSKGEFYEPFGDKQVGSSAMPYKQNPIKCEKVVSLARLVINNTTTIADTTANQWLERSLDDSAVKRVLVPETFLALDEMINVMIDVILNSTVNVIAMADNMQAEIPKLVSEGILMKAVKEGGDRQELHEAIRQYIVMDQTDFVEAVINDDRFAISREEIEELMDITKLVGAAHVQAYEYLFTEEERNGKTEENEVPF